MEQNGTKDGWLKSTKIFDGIEYQIEYYDNRNFSVDGYYYRYFSDAYDAISGDSGTIKAEKDSYNCLGTWTDVEPGFYAYFIEKNITIDTNGKIIDFGLIWTLGVTSTVTIKGGGKLKGEESSERIFPNRRNVKY